MAGDSSRPKCSNGDCSKRLHSPGAQYCSLGHRQHNIKNEERHADDDDSSDDDLIEIDGKEFAARFPTQEVKQLRDQAGINDAKKKKKIDQRGSHGIRPGNAIPKIYVTVWFYETPPAKPTNSNISGRLALDPNTPLTSPELINKFIIETLVGESKINLMDHRDLKSEELVLDLERKAWIGSQEGPKELVYEDFSGPGVELQHILEELSNRHGLKAPLPMCLPVKRKEVKESESSKPIKKEKGHSRGASMPNLEPSTSKKPRKQQASVKQEKERTIVVKTAAIKEEEREEEEYDALPRTKELIKKEKGKGKAKEAAGETNVKEKKEKGKENKESEKAGGEEEEREEDSNKEDSEDGSDDPFADDEVPDLSNLGVRRRVIKKPVKYGA